MHRAYIYYVFTGRCVLVRGGSCLGSFVPGFCLEGFVRGGFWSVPRLLEYVRYNRKLNITFQVSYVWMNLKSMTSQVSSWTPLPVTNCHIFSDTLPLERDVRYGWPLMDFSLRKSIMSVATHRPALVCSKLLQFYIAPLQGNLLRSAPSTHCAPSRKSTLKHSIQSRHSSLMFWAADFCRARFDHFWDMIQWGKRSKVSDCNPM